LSLNWQISVINHQAGFTHAVDADMRLLQDEDDILIPEAELRC